MYFRSLLGTYHRQSRLDSKAVRFRSTRMVALAGREFDMTSSSVSASVPELWREAMSLPVARYVEIIRDMFIAFENQ